LTFAAICHNLWQEILPDLDPGPADCETRIIEMNKNRKCFFCLGLPLLALFFCHCSARGNEDKGGRPAAGAAELAGPAIEKGDQNLSLGLRLKGMERLLREKQWGDATRTFADLQAMAAASGDEAALCAVQDRVWDFYFQVHRRREWFFAGSLKLAGTFYDALGGNANGTIILSHGSSAWGQNHPFVVMTALEMARRGYEVFTFDYRGFGASQDPPRLDSAAALYFPADLAAAIAFVKKEKNGKPGRIILMGHSFGAGPSLVCGFGNPGIAALVIVSPARRVRQRNLDPAASRGIAELQKRMKADMELDALPAAAALQELTPRIIIDRFAGKTFTRPLLLIDGGLEKPELRDFLASLAATLKGDVKYETVRDAPHYFGLDALRNYFRRHRGRSEEIGLEKIAAACGRLCGGRLDMAVFFNFAGLVDSWLKKNNAHEK
jgi:pimeloyl-ACP methyl ester carboxylesterase